MGKLALSGLLVASIIALVQLPRTRAQTDLGQCTAALYTADISNNNRLNRDPEYVQFLNELSENEFDSVAYEDLPQSLKVIFETYMDFSGVVDISGSKPGSYPTSQQLRLIESLCQATSEAISDPTLFAAPEQEEEGPELKATVSRESRNTNAPNDSSEAEVTTEVAAPDQEEEETEMKATVSRESRNTNTNATNEEAPEAENMNDNAPGGILGPVQNDSEFHNTTYGDNILYGTSDDPSLKENFSAALSEESLNYDEVPIVVLIEERLNATGGLWNTTTAPTFDEAEEDPIGWDEEGKENTTESSVVPSNSPSSFPTQQSSSPTITPLPSPLPSAAPTISPAPSQGLYSDCRLVMKFSDIDGDNVMNEIEYVWFLNDNWESPYPGVAFKDLPQGLKDNFFGLANEFGEIDIPRPDSSQGNETEKAADDAFLEKICADTDTALAQVGPGEQTGQEATMSTFKNCLSLLILYDSNFDTKLDEDEYHELIRQLSKDNFGKSNFTTMPAVLKDNFHTLTGDETTFDLVGAREGDELTGRQEEKFAEFCMATSFALDEALSDSSDGPKFDTADTLTMLEYAECFMNMHSFDRNKDLSLNQTEYTEVTNRLARNQFGGLLFTELPMILQENFFNLASNGDINIEGAAPDKTPGDDQQRYLEKVCVETTASINMALEALNSSQEPDTVTPSSAAPITIHSSFNIYSDVWIPPAELAMGTIRDQLEEAYKQFVRKVIDKSNTVSETARSLSRRLDEATERKPLVSLNRDSPTIYHIKDLECEGSATQETTCKTVFARYEISVVDLRDTEAVYNDFVTLTQRSIDSGMLQTEFGRIDPGSLISVIGSSDHLVYDDSSSKPLDGSVPTLSDEVDDGDGKGGNKKRTVALVAIAVACLAIGGIIGLVLVRYRRRMSEMAGEDDSFADALFGLGKAISDSDSKEKDEELPPDEGETTCSERKSTKSSIFRSHGGSNHYTSSSDDDDDASRDHGPMDVIHIYDDVAPAENNYESGISRHTQQSRYSSDVDHNGSTGSYQTELSSVPSLTRKRGKSEGNDGGSMDSETAMSFAFRRYALNGGKKKRDELPPIDHNGVV